MQQSLASRLLLHPGDGSHCILAIMSASADSMLISSTCVCVCVFVALYLTSRSPRVQPEFSTLPSPPTPLNVWWGRWKEGKGRGGSCLESPQKPLMASQSYDSEKRQLVLVWVRVPVFPSCLSTCVSVLRDRCPAGPMTLRFVDFFHFFFFFLFAPEHLLYCLLWHYTFGSISCHITGEGCVAVWRSHITFIFVVVEQQQQQKQGSAALGLPSCVGFIWPLGEFWEVRTKSRPCVRSNNIPLQKICLALCLPPFANKLRLSSLPNLNFSVSSLSLKGENKVSVSGMNIWRRCFHQLETCVGNRCPKNWCFMLEIVLFWNVKQAK